VTTPADNSKRRGRPSRFTAAERTLVRMAEPDVRSERGLRDALYRLRATRYLMADPFFSWICDAAAMRGGCPPGPGFQPRILQELGKVDDVDELLAMAGRICVERADVPTALRWVAYWRANPGAGEAET